MSLFGRTRLMKSKNIEKLYLLSNVVLIREKVLMKFVK